MDLYKKFSNLFDVNIITQLSNKDILISSSNQIKIYSINNFDKIYSFKEIESPIISIKSISEINSTKKNQIILSISLSDFSIQIISLSKKYKVDTRKKSTQTYRHKLHQTIGIKKNNKIETNLCIGTVLNYLILGTHNIIQYYINKGEEKLNFVKDKEYKIKTNLKKSDKNILPNIKGISSIKYKKYILLIIIEEIKIINQYDIKIYFFQNFELITHFRNIFLSPEKGLLSYMTNNLDDKKLYLILGDKYDRIMIIKLFDDFDIYENICLSKIIKELSYNKNNYSNNYEIKSVCGLNDGSFVICLYYKEALNEKNYIIRGKINNKNKLELLYINDNVHNNKSNFITSSTMIMNNKKPEENYFISGDHEGMIKIWKIKSFFNK